MIPSVDFEKKAYEQLGIYIQRSECSVCHTTNAECIKIDTESGEKTVCLTCSNTIILKIIELYKNVYERSIPTQDTSAPEKPEQEKRKQKPVTTKVKPQKMSMEELLQHQYYEMLDLGVPISKIAVSLKIPIETLQQYVEKWEEEIRTYVAKWGEEDRIKENKELQESN